MELLNRVCVMSLSQLADLKNLSKSFNPKGSVLFELRTSYCICNYQDRRAVISQRRNRRVVG